MNRGYNMDLSNIKSLKSLNYDKILESRSKTSPQLKYFSAKRTIFFELYTFIILFIFQFSYKI